MPEDIIKEIWIKLSSNLPEDQEADYYWKKLLERVKYVADPKYDKNSVSDHFFIIASLLTCAEQLHGFRMGINYILQLVTASQNTPSKEKFKLNQDYERLVSPLVEVQNVC